MAGDTDRWEISYEKAEYGWAVDLPVGAVPLNCQPEKDENGDVVIVVWYAYRTAGARW